MSKGGGAPFFRRYGGYFFLLAAFFTGCLAAGFFADAFWGATALSFGSSAEAGRGE